MANSNQTSQTTVLPYKAQRILSRYESAIRGIVDQYLEQKAAERGGYAALRLEDIGWAVSCALADISNSRAATPQPDPRMVRMSLAACRAGRFVTAEEFIHARKRRPAQ